MSASARRPLPALALVLPHPQLPVPRSYSPRTPRACTPSTPFAKQLIVSPRNSIDSWGSSTGNADDDSQYEWKPEQIALLIRALDALPGHLYTPFNGPVPPSNLLNQIARRVVKTHESLDWPHSMRATRAKLAEIARASDKENMTMDQVNEADETFVVGDDVVQALSNRPSLLRRPLHRQSSMDLLPDGDKTHNTLLRLSTRLQRADRIIPTYHPYARPSSRSPSPPPPAAECVTIPSRAPRLAAMVLRSRPVPRTLDIVPFPQTLRRSVSTISNPVSNADGGTGHFSRLRRADSFSCSAPTTLKRAPSFGSVNHNGVSSKPGYSVTSPSPEKQPQDPETDEEEKTRQTKVKRPRIRSNTSSRSGTPEKKKRADVSPTPVQVLSPSSPSFSRVLRSGSRVVKPASSPAALSSPLASTATKPTVSSAAKQRVKVKAATSPRSGSACSTATRPRVETIWGPELPVPKGSPVAEIDILSLDPSTQTVLPSVPSPTRTLRRVKTTLFNAGVGRRISFGSLPVPSHDTKKADAAVTCVDTPRNANVRTDLGSAFELPSL